MKRELIVINVILAFLVVGVIANIWKEWVGFKSVHSAENVQFDGEALRISEAAVDMNLLIQDWTAIAEQNLFSFDRNDLAIEPVGAPSAAGPRPFLFGTISLGTESMAMLATGNQGNRDYRPVRLGQSIDGWELIEILEKSVRIRSGNVEATVSMNDPTARMPRNQLRTIARSGGAPTVSTIHAPSSSQSAVQSSTNTSSTRQARRPNRGPITEDNVPEGFMIQRTPFGNRLIPKPQP